MSSENGFLLHQKERANHVAEALVKLLSTAAFLIQTVYILVPHDDDLRARLSLSRVANQPAKLLLCSVESFTSDTRTGAILSFFNRFNVRDKWKHPHWISPELLQHLIKERNDTCIMYLHGTSSPRRYFHDRYVLFQHLEWHPGKFAVWVFQFCL